MQELPGQYDVIILRRDRGWHSFRVPGEFAPQDVQRRFPGAILAVRIPESRSVYVRSRRGWVRGPCDVVWDGMGQYILDYPDVTELPSGRLREALRHELTRPAS